MYFKQNETTLYRYSAAFTYEKQSAVGNLDLHFMSIGGARIVDNSGATDLASFTKDHLGNTRQVLKENTGSLVVSQDNHYYAFAMKIDELSPTTTNSNRMSYNGKEIDKDLNCYHYGARFYDPAVGRWWNVDGHQQYYSFYTYVNNNPIYFIDPDGMCAEGTCPDCQSGQDSGLLSPVEKLWDDIGMLWNSFFEDQLSPIEQAVVVIATADLDEEWTRDYVPDQFTIALYGELTAGTGGSFSTGVTFLTRGDDSGFYSTSTIMGTWGFNIDAGITGGFGNFNGSISDMSSSTLYGKARAVNILNYSYSQGLENGASYFNPISSDVLWSNHSFSLGLTDIFTGGISPSGSIGVGKTF